MSRKAAAARLKPCPNTPNCVSTESFDRLHSIEPIYYSMPAAEAKEKLIEVIGSMPGARIVGQEEDYLHVEFTEQGIIGFTDDVEFVFSEGEQVIRFTSSSRQGYWDLRANRKRMETIRRKFYEHSLLP